MHKGKIAPDRTQITEWFKSLQDDISASLEGLDEHGKFREDLWDRPQGGGGRTRIMLGEHIVKGGVNFSAVHGPMPDKISSALGIGATDFYATGVSIVLHSKNPFVPIIHMNVRYFETTNGLWWFGGGIDLTPIYVNEEEARFFHQELKAACDASSSDYYQEYKKWADDYFYLKHRKETRGIGGIFFDRLSAEKGEKQDHFAFVQGVGRSFVPIYTRLFKDNYLKPYTDQNLEWQSLRRSRYVEFNLVWDRGTKFGLDTDGRTESILMSMPPQAIWRYDYQTESGSAEAFTQSKLIKGIHYA